MTKKQIILLLVLVFSAALLTGFPAETCCDEKEAPVADVMKGSGGIYWHPRQNFERVVLTVSCPDGKVFTRTFSNSSQLFQGLSDPRGNALPDGSYTYQLQAAPAHGTLVRSKNAPLKNEKRRNAFIQAGYFTILGGAMVTGNIPEEAPSHRGSSDGDGGVAVDDQVINDDLIVDGSLCVGNDCYNGYAFSFCTIALLEHNLHICFDDTSTIAGYPDTDWRIQINGTTTDGGEYFAVRDMSEGTWPLMIEGSAPSNSLYVDDYGRIGLKTATPSVELHIKDGDSPSLRLEQDTSYGFTAQTWDIVCNESNFFIRDVTGGSRLPFRIQPGAPSSALTIRETGNIGIGTWSPSQILHVKTSSVNVGLFDSTAAECWFLLENSGAGDYNSVGIGAIGDALRLRAGDAERIRILASGNVGIGTLSPSYPLEMGSGARCTPGGVWTDSSSRQYKENIDSLEADQALSALQALQPVTFNYKKEKDEQYVGFIAEDVPELVAQKDRKGLSPMDVAAVLTKVVQEQQKFITQLQNDQKENRETSLRQNELIKRLNKRIARLEKQEK
ncbi:MAG: tail fiber domain-containing protein [bacterium]|nr:tail fiber domain-containing protein [bacterium]